MAEGFSLEIVTPDRKMFQGMVDMLIIRTTEGDIGILRNHVNTVVPLGIGAARVRIDGEERIAACAGGFMTVVDGKVSILTDAAEWNNEIDVERCEAAIERANARMEDPFNHDLDRARAILSIKRARNRIEISGR